MSDDPLTNVSARRIERLIEVLSLLSLGEYDPALAQIEINEAEDRMSVLEQALALFIQELADTRRESEAHVAKLEDSRREIEQKLETIERQRVAINDLSTPIIELWDDILTLPIVGIVDTQRSIDMTERLLDRISKSGARCVIVDVTGIDVIDTMTANHFLQMIRAAQLLGAHCVVTGMNAHTSQTMVSIGVDLGQIRTLRSLKEGLEHCVRHLRGQRRGDGSSSSDKTREWKS